MEWTGSLNGKKGYRSYKLLSSNLICGTVATANYTKEGLFRFCYRLNTPYLLNKKEVLKGLKGLLNFKGRYLFIIDRISDSNSIELYCLMDQEPTTEKMEKLEKYLKSL